MDKAKYRIEVYYKTGDSRGEALLRKLRGLGYHLSSLYISDNYLISVDLSREQLHKVADSFIQPVTQEYVINNPYSPKAFDYAVEIGFLPGVTDNVAHTARETIEDIIKTGLEPETVFTSITYFFKDDMSRDMAFDIGMELHNPLIQRMKILSCDEYKENNGMGYELPVVRMRERLESMEVDLKIPDHELLKLGKEGIADGDGARRGPLALDMPSLKAIVDYFQNIEKRNPTDIELESIAQTWSEHCKHRIFGAELDEIKEGVYKRYIKEATFRIRKEKGIIDSRSRSSQR